MDEETKARFDDVSAALGTINTALAEIIGGMVTKKEIEGLATKKELDARFDAIMARMNDGFERVLAKQQTLQVADDTLSQRVTRLEQDVRQLRGGSDVMRRSCNQPPSGLWPGGAG
jgi:hypothetical protein